MANTAPQCGAVERCAWREACAGMLTQLLADHLALHGPRRLGGVGLDAAHVVQAGGLQCGHELGELRACVVAALNT